LQRVDVEPRSDAEIPARIISCNALLPRAGVGCYQHDAELCGDALRASFDHESLFAAGETCQVVENGYRALRALRRQENGKTHLRSASVGVMAIEALHTIEAAML
jgi:hypothetical protein